MKKIIVRSRASLRPMAYAEFVRIMKIKKAGEASVRLYLEYVYQHQKLEKFK